MPLYIQYEIKYNMQMAKIEKFMTNKNGLFA